MFQTKKILFLILIFFFLFFVGSFFSSSEGAKRRVIGIIMSMNADQKKYSLDIRDSVILQMRRLNQKLESKKQISLIFISGGKSPESAAESVQLLYLKHKVLAIIGPPEISQAISSAKAAENLGVPFISLSSSDALTDVLRKWAFSVAPSVALEVGLLLDFLQEKKLKKISLLTFPKKNALEARKQIFSSSSKRGISILSDEVFGLKEYNFLSYLNSNRIQSSQAVVHWAANSSSSDLVQASLTYNGKQPFFILGKNFFIKKDFKSINVTRPIFFVIPKFFTVFLLPDFYEYKKRVAYFRKDFKFQFRREPTIFAARSVDAVKILSSAIFQASGNRKLIRTYLKKTAKYRGLTGYFDFTKNKNHGIKNAYAIAHFQNGKWNLESFE
ncbi:MAG: ABC transporter substrate-binding protein [Nitrospinota bacterium]|nr:ABC transporter substrate-binding protein [Nitrospinota bacterium]